jgi:hypothetical protein
LAERACAAFGLDRPARQLEALLAPDAHAKRGRLAERMPQSLPPPRIAQTGHEDPGRPFFIWMGVRNASRAPAARRWGMS